MGYAIFPLRSGGGRVLVDAAKVVALQEDAPGDGTGLASVWLDSGPQFRLAESATVVYTRIAAALNTTGLVSQ